MPSLLGKRKARSVEDKPEALADAHEILKRHFEAHFKPLGVAARAAPPKKRTNTDSESDSDGSDGNLSDGDDSNADEDLSDSGWSGVSTGESIDEGEEGEGEDTPVVEVVDHTSAPSTTESATAKMSKRELKAYLSSRPPDRSQLAAAQQTPSAKKAPSDQDQPEDSAAFLANDLALQRLIAESHILSAAGANPSHWQSEHAAGTAANTRAFAAGRIARKTSDMRIQALGAKESILTQAKMPMSMRKGIVRAAAAREEKRRREARENGIVLEKEAKKPAKTKKKRRGDRPVDLPAVGRMRGAELKVSAREAQAIAASVRGPVGKGKHKRRR
ncbi:407b7d6d-30ca-4090-a772-65d54238098e [Thermothielavioides terrestris]|uniref:Protein FAF1 n=2 Tax=Thermothielavioides terrestris TaxID=2587410 RepID=G2RBT4_THETT|nr:uncharacterized protein THITE_60058 [Thermothielavioides terrestris NRRL 8126]AEO69255.1 hypothetical protein THITE_60058 [Thermothielavioides terrestris NRRL 8126]SPQ22467.1 407b7d6d-30ca-4090-a772-65d54238098e [Thermothielavioides terrestris]